MKLIPLIALFFILVFGSLAKAQDIDVIQKTYIKTLLCATHTDLTEDLKKNHGESRKWWAVNSENELIELYVNNENGAWTIVITNNQKLSCALIGADHSGANYDIDSTVETIQ